MPLGCQIGANGGVRGDAQGEEVEVCIQRQFAGVDVVAGLVVGQEAVAPLPHPADVTAEFLRRPQHQNLFWIERVFDAEAAADIGDQHPEPVCRQAKGAGEGIFDGVRHLGAGGEGVAAGCGIIGADGTAGFQRADLHPRVAAVEPDDMGGLGEGGGNGRAVPGLPGEAEIIRGLRPDGGRTGLHGGFGADHGGQRVILHPDLFGGVAGDGVGFGDDHGHAVSDEADDVLRQCGVLRTEGEILVFRRAGEADQGAAGGDGAEPIGHVIRAGEHRQHAGQRAGGAGVYADDPGMGVRAAQHGGDRNARMQQVGGETALPAQQAGIFLAAQWLAERVGTHVAPSGLPAAA